MLRKVCDDGGSPVQPDVRINWAASSLAVALALSLAGCSADIMRFDAPVLGYSGAGARTDIQPARRDASLFDQTPSGQTGGTSTPYQYSPSARTGSVTRGQLPGALPGDRAPRYAASTPPQRTAMLPPVRTYRPETATAPAYTRAPVYPQAPIASANTITVQRGDTLYELSRRHGVPVADIKAANGLQSNIIRPGQTLVLRRGAGGAPDRARTRRVERAPPQTRVPVARTAIDGDGTYTVRRGDSLYAIARRRGISLAALMRINGITNARRVRPGTVLKFNDVQSSRVVAAAPTTVRVETRVNTRRPASAYQPPAAPGSRASNNPGAAVVSPNGAPQNSGTPGSSFVGVPSTTQPRIINSGVQPRRVTSVPVP
ncbi:MAG TPA: LysM peptidoglycan-binding domain-containing protein, partial [Hyphomicrobiaceae bacterium]|nr:LysM peptidoglycan-binding domain-containing protein [Hyphomicrobiaceae bacterium]